VTFEVLTSVFLKFKVSWDFNLCRWVSSCRRFDGFYSLYLQSEDIEVDL